MILLVAGLALFIGVHSIPSIVPLRAALVARLGAAPYTGSKGARVTRRDSQRGRRDCLGRIRPTRRSISGRRPWSDSNSRNRFDNPT